MQHRAASGVASLAKLSSGDETSHEGYREKLHRRKLASEPHSRNQRQLVLRGAAAARDFKSESKFPGDGGADAAAARRNKPARRRATPIAKIAKLVIGSSP